MNKDDAIFVLAVIWFLSLCGAMIWVVFLA